RGGRVRRGRAGSRPRTQSGPSGGRGTRRGCSPRRAGGPGVPATRRRGRTSSAPLPRGEDGLAERVEPEATVVPVFVDEDRGGPLHAALDAAAEVRPDA